MTNKEKALLDLIAYAEGTLGVSQNGYDVAVGYRIILGWDPNTKIVHGGSKWYHKQTNSTAAGRYQFKGSTWMGNWIGGTKKKEGQNVPMTKENQDAAALWLIKNKLKSYYIDKRDVTIEELDNKNKFNIALQKLASTWASLPLTKTVTIKGVTRYVGSSYYANDGVNKSKLTAEHLWEIYNKALNLYTKI